MCEPVLEFIVAVPVLATVYAAGALTTFAGLWLFYSLTGRTDEDGEG